MHVELAFDSFAVHESKGDHLVKVLEPLGQPLVSVLENAFNHRAGLNEPDKWRGRVLKGDLWCAHFAKRACLQILLGIHALHSQDIAHRDIQPGNVCMALSYDLSSLSENEIHKSVWPIDDIDTVREDGEVRRTSDHQTEAKDASDADDEDKPQSDSGASDSDADDSDADDSDADDSDAEWEAEWAR